MKTNFKPYKNPNSKAKATYRPWQRLANHAMADLDLQPSILSINDAIDTLPEDNS